MSKAITITGTVSHHTFGMGFWGITDTKGNEWRPVNMPDQLKVKGATVTCKIKPVEDEVSIHMWGQPVEIISFETPR